MEPQRRFLDSRNPATPVNSTKGRSSDSSHPRTFPPQWQWFVAQTPLKLLRTTGIDLPVTPVRGRLLRQGHTATGIAPDSHRIPY